MTFAKANCTRLPESIENDINEILRASVVDLPGLPAHVTRLLDRFDQLVEKDGF
ncbi:MAG TPA: hypothetical protein VF326_07695 [Anaerolineaceae bacterium]